MAFKWKTVSDRCMRNAAMAVVLSGPCITFAETVTVSGTAGITGANGAAATNGVHGQDGQSVTATANKPNESNSATARGGAAGHGGNGGDAQPPKPGGAGGNGGAGGSATAIAGVNGVNSLTAAASATGGTGGFNGRHGRANGPSPSGAPGQTGSGGEAIADSTARTSASAAAARAEATALGGDGGMASDWTGQFGSDFIHIGPGGMATARSLAESADAMATAISIATGGAGAGGYDGAFRSGNGGNAHASAQARNTGSQSVRVEATAQGGDSAASSTLPGTTVVGGTGGGATLGLVRGESVSGGVSVTGIAIGGKAGISPGGIGGEGGSIALNNAVSGSTTGALTLVQTAVGGQGGGSADGFTSGQGGTALSTLTLNDTVASLVDVTLRATGGRGGGTDSGATGTTGSVGQVSGAVYGNGAVTLRGEAQGGSGGLAKIVAAGNGRSGVIDSLYAASLGGGPVSVLATQIGGDGGNSILGGISTAGDGADSVMVNLVDGQTTGALSLTQNAVGGGGGLDESGSAQAGRAESRINKTGSFDLLSLTSRATGGRGAPAAGIGVTGGIGGAANARASGNNPAGDGTAITASTGGKGGRGGAEGGPVPATGGSGGASEARTESVALLTAIADSNSIGGAGGDLFGSRPNNPTTGAGGLAISYSSADSQTRDATATATATGGEGGQQGTTGTAIVSSGGRGGDAQVSVDSNAALTSTANGNAFGGTGASALGGSAVSGRGGDAVVSTVSAYSSHAAAIAIGNARGGDAGGRLYSAKAGDGGQAFVQQVNAYSGVSDATSQANVVGGNIVGTGLAQGRGGDASVTNAVSGTAPGTLTLLQDASGGIGFYGGNALSSLTYADQSAERLVVSAKTIGGTGTVGGNADTQLNIASRAYLSVDSQAIAYGTGQSTAFTSGKASTGVVKTTTAWGSSGITGTRMSVSVEAPASAGTALNGKSQGGYTNVADALSSGSEAGVLGMSLSAIDNLGSLLADNPNVRSVVFPRYEGLVVVDLDRASDSLAVAQYRFKTTLQIAAVSTRQLLVLGLIDANGTSIDELTLTMTSSQANSASLSADSTAAALSGLNDDVLAIPLLPGTNPTTLTIDVSITSSTPNDLFGFSILAMRASAVPEPGLGMALLTPVFYMLRRNRRLVHAANRG